MGRILVVVTQGSDDPTKSALAFVTAVGALEAEHEVSIALLGEAAYLLKEEVADEIHGVATPPLPELIEQVVSANVPVYV